MVSELFLRHLVIFQVFLLSYFQVSSPSSLLLLKLLKLLKLPYTLAFVPVFLLGLQAPLPFSFSGIFYTIYKSRIGDKVIQAFIYEKKAKKKKRVKPIG